MISLTKNTKTKPEDVKKRAIAFFGPKGLGLKITSEEACSVCLVGGGGDVRVAAAREEKGTKVDIETREWEPQAKDFMALLK
jgi:hypothetical protein